MRTAAIAALSLASFLGFSRSARAETDCAFSRVGSHMFLRADCRTTETLFVPDGVTLHGNGHTITAEEGDDGRYDSAVLQNAGATAHVTHLTIDTLGLTPVCHETLEERLRGVYLFNASGSVTNVTVTHLAQNESGCQEGNAIEARNTLDEEKKVAFIGNRVSGYQKTGLLALGKIDALISLNRVRGLGPIGYIAQNGIQVSYGATGTVRFNDVSGNVYTGENWSSGGITIDAPADGLAVEFNTLSGNDVGIFIRGMHHGSVRLNRIADSVYVPIYAYPDSSENEISHNFCKASTGEAVACTLEE